MPMAISSSGSLPLLAFYRLGHELAIASMNELSPFGNVSQKIALTSFN